MTNLLSETAKDIERSGHTTADIIFIGSEATGHRCSWNQFSEIAKMTDYDAGFGSQKIATDLIIVFKDGMKMWRHEYDGSERWDYSEPFKMPEASLPISRLVVPEERIGWCSLEECNAPRENGDV